MYSEHHAARRPTAAVMRSISSAMRAVVFRMVGAHTIICLNGFRETE
jgi:hypothetical protein